MASLGFVGLGMMGGRMVKRLLDAGHQVKGYNRTKSKVEWLISEGMEWVATPRAAAEGSDVVFTNLANGEALRSVTDGPDGVLAGLRAGQLYIDMGTVSPRLIKEISQQAAAKGATMLDAPVSGSKLTLEQGKLSIMASGKKDAFDRAKPILEAIGPIVTYIGEENGQAMAVKIAINISIPTQVVTFIEGVLLAERYGVPREKSIDVMLSGAIASPGLKYRGPFLANMPDEAWFDVDMMQKDIMLALDLSRELGVPLPTTSVTNDLLSAARGLGLANKDFAIIVKVLERMSSMND
jgi:3-hydroxyisobutyrate dehydrogenase-like beta-hydroxyacid dehydrogenase